MGISITLDSTLLLAIDKMAEKESRKRSNMISVLLSRAVKAEEDKNKQSEG